MSAVLGSAPPLPASRWRWPLAALALVLLALLLLYRDTLVAMVTIWERSETFAHCFLVPPISLWLAWRSRARLAGLTPQPQPWLLLGLAAFAFLWLLGDMAGVNAAAQFAVTALLVLTVPAVLGLAVARVLAFPLLFLFFMVPVGEFLMPQFMEWTADFTVLAIRLTGIPVYREGLNFVIPSGSWSVVEACSGIRYLIASFMVGTLFAYLNYRSLRRRLIFVGVSLLVPLVANWLRAYMIVMLGHFSGNKLAVGVDHLIYGWVFFGVVIGVMFLIGARWSEAPAPVAAAGAAGSVAPGGGAMRLGMTLVLALAVLLVPHLVLAHFERQGRQAASAPLALADLPGAPAADTQAGFEPVFLNPSSTALRSYQFEGRVVTVHVGYYRHQGYGRKLVSSQNYLVGSEDKRWRRTSSGIAMHPAGGQAQPWRSAELVEGHVGTVGTNTQRLDVRQIYWVDDRLTASDARAALYSLAGRLLGRGDDGALITIYTAGNDAAATSALLGRFIEQQLSPLLSQVRAYKAAR